MSRNYKIGLLTLVTTFAIAAGAAFADSGAELSIGLDAADARQLDPHFAASGADRVVVDMVFNGLFRYLPGQVSDIELDLAESYEVSDDGLTFTFRLREGVWFHPFPGYPEGHELTAADVVFSINKAGDPETSTYVGDMEVFTAEAVDDYTVRVQMSHRVPTPERLLADYSGGFIVSKAAFDSS